MSHPKVPKRPAAQPAPTPTDATQDLILLDHLIMDHLINLTDQVRRMAAALRSSGISVPPDVGTLGPASEEVIRFYTDESLRNLSPDRGVATDAEGLAETPPE